MKDSESNSQLTRAHSTDQLLKIGAGHCGSVWADAFSSCSSGIDPDTLLVIKREDCGEGRSITHEHEMHCHVIQNMQQALTAGIFNKSRFNVPRCEGFLDNNAAIWPQILPRLPKGFTACNALISEKIPPMPRPVRKLIAERLGLGTDANEVADDVNNAHCLIRPYLGRRKRTSHDATGQTRPRKHRFYSLRNLPFYVDQMEELGLDPKAYALVMAEGLAFLHWHVKVDANDVEFVLAQTRQGASQADQPSLGLTDFQSTAFGLHSMWILDFDCCRKMSMDEAGIQKACQSFWRNDPYYPRPGSDNLEDQSLWKSFRSRFLEISKRILEGEKKSVKKLPERLVDLIQESKGKFTRGTIFQNSV